MLKRITAPTAEAVRHRQAKFLCSASVAANSQQNVPPAYLNGDDLNVRCHREGAHDWLWRSVGEGPTADDSQVRTYLYQPRNMSGAD